MKGDSKIKLFRLEIFAFFKSSRVLIGQRDQAGFEVEYNSVEFKPYSAAIDKKFGEKARKKLEDRETWNW